MKAVTMMSVRLYEKLVKEQKETIKRQREIERKLDKFARAIPDEDMREYLKATTEIDERYDD